jgi:SAM-dependent methyltransferase
MSHVVDEDRMNSKVRLERRMISEAAATGFSHIDQQVAFYSQVSALIRPEHVLLDFGAGRGEWFDDDPVVYRRNLQNFRGRVAHVDGCDVDEAVMSNPTLDQARLIEPGKPLPYSDGRFDIALSRYVFEHLDDPASIASELARIIKPGGWLCVITPNKWGYVAVASRLVPNKKHAAMLRAIQPHRKEQDVFPTRYLLNTPSDLRRHFGKSFDVFAYRDSAVPSYHFGKPLAFRMWQVVHRLLPPPFATGLFALMQRKAHA